MNPRRLAGIFTGIAAIAGALAGAIAGALAFTLVVTALGRPGPGPTAVPGPIAPPEATADLARCHQIPFTAEVLEDPALFASVVRINHAIRERQLEADRRGIADP